MTSEEIKQFGLVIIESLPDHETKTGFNLHSTIIKYKTFEFPDLSAEFYDINDRKKLFWLLKELVRKAVDENHFFILHIEAHGFDDGIELKNGEEVTWGEMIPYFQEINIRFHNYLFILLGICRGAGILKYINPMERAPFRALISSEKDIYVQDLIHGFEEFYKYFFFELDAVESLEKYNSVISDPKDKLIHVTAEYCFDAIADIERLTADKTRLKATYKSSLLKNYPDLKYFSDDYTNRYVENKLTEIFEDLKTRKDYFLMKDLQK
ncbi:MAG: hypothetical protein JNM71_17585 [Flavobacterium lindanitolerans]|uniref:Uncharacterized protein n=1 Tax=Flavobacterium microcysteis TaxID=2596891 RepID=A0A501Q0Z1_9FLAO|nr:MULTISPECIES: hypothetical protein [Flavobacterium]MBL7869826.1 hypothetical protein [Flavobacterium lindanitolerans]TPD66004.1 hypothetical protein FJA49_17660 [Flavobacterium microcysteis]